MGQGSRGGKGVHSTADHTLRFNFLSTAARITESALIVVRLHSQAYADPWQCVLILRCAYILRRTSIHGSVC